jgi:hypothetical protein
MASEKLEVDLDLLTVGEIEQAEEMTGIAIDVLGMAGAPKGKMYRVLGYLVKRRDNPSFTYEDAGNLIVEPTSEEIRAAKARATAEAAAKAAADEAKSRAIPPTASGNSQRLPQ